MRIYKIKNKQIKTAKSFTDLQKWILHGVDPVACREEFAPQIKKRRAMQEKAKIQAEQLGHRLFRNWSPLNSNWCRKCAMTVSLPNVCGTTDSPDYIGSAVTVQCHTHLGHVSDEYFEISDDILDEGVPLNREPLDTFM